MSASMRSSERRWRERSPLLPGRRAGPRGAVGLDGTGGGAGAEALLLLAGAGGELGEEAAVDQARQRVLQALDAREGLHALGALLEPAGRLVAAKEEPCEDRVVGGV